MNGNNNGQRPAFTPRKKILLNDYRQPHPTSIEPVAGAKYPAQLMWEQANNGKLMLKVNDGVYKEGAKTNHKEVEMDYMHRGVLFDALIEATTNPDFKTRQIAVQWKQFVFAGGSGRMSDQPVLQVFLTITRDKDGCITLGYSKGDYKVQFKFKGPKDTVVYMKNDAGERYIDEGVMSRWAVRAWVNFHRPILDNMDTTSWEPAKPKDGAPAAGGNRGGNGGGGGNSGGGNDFDSGGNSFDEDVDF
jgi:hypothetical protein